MNWPYVQLGPIGTNHHVSGFFFFFCFFGWSSDILKDHPSCSNCKWQKEPCEWVPGSWVCSACAKWKIGCMRLDMPRRLKRKSQLFIESDVEGDWVHRIKRPQVDKGKGQMEMADLDLDEEKAWAWYWVDIHWLVGLNEAIVHSFEALVVLLADWLQVSRTENPEGAGLEGEGEEEEEPENAED